MKRQNWLEGIPTVKIVFDKVVEPEFFPRSHDTIRSWREEHGVVMIRRLGDAQVESDSFVQPGAILLWNGQEDTIPAGFEIAREFY